MNNDLINVDCDVNNANVSKVVLDFFQTLKNRQICCCIWKGSCDITDVLYCDDDIDLLVDRSKSKEVLDALNEYNFKRVHGGKDRSQLGVEEYYAYDEELKKYVHIQLYFQLIIGERLIENYHLPIEKHMLDSVVYESGLPLVSPEFEIIVFVIRKYIQKNNTYVLRPGSSNKISKDVKSEIKYLTEKSDINIVIESLESFFPVLDKKLFNNCVDNMTDDISILQWITLRKKIIHALKPYKRKSSGMATLLWLYRRFLIAREKILFSSNVKKIPIGGGVSIAIVGSDGSGKSSAIDYLSSWLGSVFKVRYFHMGRPKPSLITSLLSRGAKMLLPIACKQYNRGEAGMIFSAEWPRFLSWIPVFLMLSIARDRYKLFSKIQKETNKGCISLIDRYPVKEITQMDCARIHTLANQNWIVNYMSMLEQRYYKKMIQTDLTILLIVDSEVAAMRQPGDGYEYVIRRATEIKSIALELSDKFDVIDTNVTIEQVQSKLRTLLWKVV
jgi:thymidylate kinase